MKKLTKTNIDTIRISLSYVVEVQRIIARIEPDGYQSEKAEEIQNTIYILRDLLK